ncbi:MAG: gas vesicle protein GvpD [Nanoarchaeota archaeon]|nr:gas vesicle protein GvpD [Nanoarchaeota archaeon]
MAKESDNMLIKTGVPGFDQLLKGGLRQGSVVLISGVPGTGKTLIGMQFLLEGLKSGEKGLMITTEESPDAVKLHAAAVGLDLDGFEVKNQLFFVQQPISDKKLMSIATPVELIKREKIKRVVLDSLTLFKYMHAAGAMDFRKELLSFLDLMRAAGVTIFVTAERATASLDDLQYKSFDFLFDGVVILTRIRKGASFERCITVQKLRGQDHSMNVYPFSIGSGGITIYPNQPPFSLMEQDEKKK